MITIQDYNEIGYNLQCFHEIFNKFWQIGEPVLADDIETCQVCYDKDGEYLKFKFNPEFWNSIDNYERAYFIAHECMHVILNHGKRASLNEDRESKDVSIDVVVNQMLTNHLFLYKTDKIKEHNIFLEDLVEQGHTLEGNHSLEYYYNILNVGKPKGNDGDDGKGQSQFPGLPVNDHSYLGEDSSKVIEKAFGLEPDDLNEEDKKEVEAEANNAGTESLDKIFEVFNTKTYKTPNWQFLFKKIVKSKREKFYREANKLDWTRQNRRTVLFQSDILLPNDQKESPKDKIEMWFFQDISGSCIHLKDKFISLARKIPSKIFDVKYHTFDTSCRQIPITTTEVRGGGGTCFQQIENYIISQTVNKGLKYPEVVVHLTDGESSSVIQPLKPKNHFWLLTQDSTRCIPQESFRLVLDDFNGSY